MILDVIASGSKGNAYILQNEQEALLIEAGVRFDAILKALDFNPAKVAGCLISHEHGDHAKFADQVLKAAIPVYCSKGTAESIKADKRPEICEAGKVYRLGNFRFIPFATMHDAAEPYGFFIQHPETGNVLFATDTKFLKYTFQGLDNIMVECNYSREILDRNVAAGRLPVSVRNRIIDSHFEITNLIGTLKANDLTQVKNIVLLHLSDNNSNAESFKAEVFRETGKKTFVAAPGLRINFNKQPF